MQHCVQGPLVMCFFFGSSALLLTLDSDKENNDALWERQTALLGTYVVLNEGGNMAVRTATTPGGASNILNLKILKMLLDLMLRFLPAVCKQF